MEDYVRNRSVLKLMLLLCQLILSYFFFNQLNMNHMT